MSWNLEGMVVRGMYMGEFPVTGRVELSRVKFGGEVSHHIALSSPIVVYGAVRDRIILEHRFVESCEDSISEEEEAYHRWLQRETERFDAEEAVA